MNKALTDPSNALGYLFGYMLMLMIYVVVFLEHTKRNELKDGKYNYFL